MLDDSKKGISSGELFVREITLYTEWEGQKSLNLAVLGNMRELYSLTFCNNDKKSFLPGAFTIYTGYALKNMIEISINTNGKHKIPQTNVNNLLKK